MAQARLRAATVRADVKLNPELQQTLTFLQAQDLDSGLVAARYYASLDSRALKNSLREFENLAFRLTHEAAAEQARGEAVGLVRR